MFTKPSVFKNVVYDQTGDGLSLWVYTKTHTIHDRRVTEQKALGRAL